MDLSQLVFAVVAVVIPVQLGAQLSMLRRLLAAKTAYKTMTLCWATAGIAASAIQLWPGAGIAAVLTAINAMAWWRHRNDDDDEGPRRKRLRLKASARAKLPMPVAVARPVPTDG